MVPIKVGQNTEETPRKISLPYDYSRCAQEGCPSAGKCARFLAPGRPNGHQTYILPLLNPGDTYCDYLIEIE